MRIAVLGVGLIGGSIALAARERLGATVSGYDRSPEALQAALEIGALDRAAPDIADAVADAEAVFVAVPVGALPGTVGDGAGRRPAPAAWSAMSARPSVPSSALRTTRASSAAIPLAGAETAGVSHARADLFEGATWYLTPTASTSGLLYERLHRLLRGLGARPAAIDARDPRRDPGHRLSPSRTSWPTCSWPRRRTRWPRAASACPPPGRAFATPPAWPARRAAIWRDIYLSNRDVLAVEVGTDDRAPGAGSRALRAGDGEAIVAWNDAAAADRRRLLEAELVGGPLCELRASVPTAPAWSPQLALELGRAGVNIADMALYPAPDMSEGVVALWVAGEEPARRAEELVGRLGFPVARP